MSKKGIFVLLCGAVVFGVAAQQAPEANSRVLPFTNLLAGTNSLTFSERTTNEIAAIGPVVLQPALEDGLESQLSDRLTKAISLSLSEGKQNEIAAGNVTYGGIAVAAFATDNLFQLFNPFAPAKYGSGEDNLLRSLKPPEASGWKLFSIRF